MNASSNLFAPRLLAGFGTAALVAGVGLFASSRPARSVGGPIPVTVSNAPLGVTSTEGQPVEVYVNTNTSPPSSNLVYTVPAGKRLVVESMSLIVGGGSNISYTGVVRVVDSTGNLVSLASLSTGTVTADVATATQPMHLHVVPGGKVYTDVYVRGNSLVSGYISLSGYLIDAP